MKQKMKVMPVVSIDIEATEADNKEAWGITSKKPSYLKHTRIKAEEKQKLDFSLVDRFPVATVENLALWGFAIHYWSTINMKSPPTSKSITYILYIYIYVCMVECRCTQFTRKWVFHNST